MSNALRSIALAAIVLNPAAAPAQQPVASHVSPAAARPAVYEVARVNGVSLTSDRLEASVNAMIPLESFHRTVSPEKLREFRGKALDTLIDEELEYQAGLRLGQPVSEAEVAAALAAVRTRYRSAAALDEALRRGGATRADLEREIRRQIIIRKTRDRLVTAQCQVGRDEAQRFFAANPQRFVVPERLRIQAITIGVEPSSTPQQWKDARARADDVRRQIAAGVSFEALARKYSTDPSRDSGGDMGIVHRGSLADEFEAAARDLKRGETSGVIQTLFGYHVVRVTEILPAVKKSFAEVGDGIRADLTAKRCSEMDAAWVARLRARATIVIGGRP